MRWKSLAVVACLAPCGGCHIFHSAARIIVNEPAQYFDERHLEKQLRKDAKHAWAEVCRQYPKRTFTDDFVDGFRDGYTDYLDNGGTAQIPAVPPMKYRRAKFRNPEGWERTRQYFLGFKYGMDVAVDTGCRTFLTVPIVMPEQAPPVDQNITVLPSPPDTTRPVLGAPRPVTPPDGPVTPPMPGKESPVVPADKGKDTPSAKPGDKDTPPEAAILIPIPEPKSSLPVAPVPKPIPPGPSGDSAPTSEPPKFRPLFPISTPAETEPPTVGKEPAAPLFVPPPVRID